VVIDYSTGARVEGPDRVIAQIRNMLGGCGPTQHLLGNHVVTVDGDHATSSCKVRAFSAGPPTRRTLERRMNCSAATTTTWFVLLEAGGSLIAAWT
jgi:hypothetical protein